MTKTATVTVGWTKSKMPEYSSFSDGYRPGAEQHTVTFDLVVSDSWDAERVCWAVVEATNSPMVSAQTPGEVGNIYRAIKATGYDGRGAHWSFSPGDTVTVDGAMYASNGYAFEAVSA